MKIEAEKAKPSAIVGSDDDLLTIRQVARHLCVDDTTVRRWISSGAMEAVALPHRGKRRVYRVQRSTLKQIATPQTFER